MLAALLLGKGTSQLPPAPWLGLPSPKNQGSMGRDASHRLGATLLPAVPKVTPRREVCSSYLHSSQGTCRDSWLSRGDSIISCLWAGEIPPLLIYSHPRNAIFHYCSYVAETGHVLPPSDQDCSRYSHPSIGLFVLSRGKCCWVGSRGNNAGDTVMPLLGRMPAGAHRNLLEYLEKDPNVSPPWVPGAAPGKALVWLMGKGVQCLQAGAKADTGTEPPISPGKRGWGLRKPREGGCMPVLHLGFQNQSLAGGRSGWSQCCWGPLRREVPFGLI